MTTKAFTPTLGRIIEIEDVESHVEESIDDILNEYEVLTETDLLIALDLDPKAFKKGQYLSGFIYGEQEDDESDEDDDDISEFGSDEVDRIPQNGGIRSGSDFENLHRGTLEKNKTIIGKFSSMPEIDQINNRSSIISDTYSVEYQNGDSESLNSGSVSQHRPTRPRKISGQSYTCKNGEELLNKYLQNNLGYKFESKEGRKIFVRAILKKYMSIYYVISPPQVTTVDFEGSGISTLLAIKNALKIKDNRLVHDGASMNGGDSGSLITSCVLFDGAPSELNFDDFACTARLNDLSVEAIIVSKESDIKTFR